MVTIHIVLDTACDLICSFETIHFSMFGDSNIEPLSCSSKISPLCQVNRDFKLRKYLLWKCCSYKSFKNFGTITWILVTGPTKEQWSEAFYKRFTFHFDESVFECSDVDIDSFWFTLKFEPGTFGVSNENQSIVPNGPAGKLVNIHFIPVLIKSFKLFQRNKSLKVLKFQSFRSFRRNKSFQSFKNFESFRRNKSFRRFKSFKLVKFLLLINSS